ncbi:MAG: hypothetical protein PHX08_09170 [Lachnospiraceae bacterium]|nr:hypothetical protein [Lachnospiraceae bacterium]
MYIIVFLQKILICIVFVGILIVSKFEKRTHTQYLLILAFCLSIIRFLDLGEVVALLIQIGREMVLICTLIYILAMNNKKHIEQILLQCFTLVLFILSSIPFGWLLQGGMQEFWYQLFNIEVEHVGGLVRQVTCIRYVMEIIAYVLILLEIIICSRREGKNACSR